jgi:hypothetical protein
MPIPDRAAIRSKLRLVAVVVVTALVPVALWGWLAFESRTAALEMATADQRHVVEAVGEHTLKLLDAQALLLDLTDQAAGERDCQALRSDDGLQAFLSLATRKSPGTVSLLILNADGHPCMGSMGSGPLQMDDRDRSFRDYFSGARRPARANIMSIGRSSVHYPAFPSSTSRRRGRSMGSSMVSCWQP